MELPTRTCSLLLPLLSACAHPNVPLAPGSTSPPDAHASTPLPQRFEELLREFARHDRDGSFEHESCVSLGREFVALSKRHERLTKTPLGSALYNAGLAFARCGDEERAREQFRRAEAALDEPELATAQLILFDHDQTHNLDQSIERLQRVVVRSRFSDPDTLVKLAALQMERGSPSPHDDLSEAKKNLQRALAIDDGSVAAMNQLALYYLKLAQSRVADPTQPPRSLTASGREPPRLPRQQLDPALLVLDRALEQHGRHAPLHNTLGLVRVELADYTGASRSFDRARQLDPRMFEAQMNFAALSSMFRAFNQAEDAYRDALVLRPKSYEARVGLAVALRGQLNASNRDRLLPEIDEQLAAARKAAPGRPEADFNGAIVTQDERAKTDDTKVALRELRQAARLLRRFLAKAANAPEYADSVGKAKNRLEDIDGMIVFLEQGQLRQRARAPAQDE